MILKNIFALEHFGIQLKKIENKKIPNNITDLSYLKTLVQREAGYFIYIAPIIAQQIILPTCRAWW